MHLVVISICKDEEATIGDLLDRVPDTIDGINSIDKLVVSDGSQDRTAEIARRRGATVIEGTTQRRLAFRFQQAINTALEMGADLAVNIDGDLQFDPNDIPALVEPIVSGRAEFVAADRFSDPATLQKRKPANMPLGKYWGNRLGAGVVSALSGQSFNDVTCGFRAYSRNAMLSLNINTKYTYTQESFQLLAQNGTNIETLPTAVTYYPGRRSRVVTSFWSFVASSGLNILRSYRDFAPLRFFLALGILPLLGGFLAVTFVGIHWLDTGRTSPYTTLGILGGYFFSLGLLLLVAGLVADMLVRSTRNQEKILRMLKEERYLRFTDENRTQG
jgi:glycosyltransferase involved in cell wall biosynthesis